MTIANALAVTIAITYIVCTIFVLVVPDLYFAVTQSWFHGIDLSKIAFVNVTVGSFLTGLITITAVAWAFSFLFVYVHSLLARK